MAIDFNVDMNDFENALDTTSNTAETTGNTDSNADDAPFEGGVVTGTDDTEVVHSATIATTTSLDNLKLSFEKIKDTVNNSDVESMDLLNIMCPLMESNIKNNESDDSEVEINTFGLSEDSYLGLVQATIDVMTYANEKFKKALAVIELETFLAEEEDRKKRKQELLAQLKDLGVES